MSVNITQGEIIAKRRHLAVVKETHEGFVAFAIWNLSKRPIEKIWVSGTRRAALRQLRVALA